MAIVGCAGQKPQDHSQLLSLSQTSYPSHQLSPMGSASLRYILDLTASQTCIAALAPSSKIGPGAPGSQSFPQVFPSEDQNHTDRNKPSVPGASIHLPIQPLVLTNGLPEALDYD